MQSLWKENEASQIPAGDDLAMRVFTSRLLGQDEELVLHGGGNTSVKIQEKDFFGEEVEVLYVKGSGWDLGTIEKEGFAPVRIDVLHKMAQMEELSDPDMVAQQRAAMLNPSAPNPSIEAILHGILPQKYVDHTHANAILALTNHPDGEKRVKELYGDRMLIVPYVMPGFILSKTVYDLIQGKDLSEVDGLILMNHGIFTFDDDARRSYELMIEKVSMAEDYLAKFSGGASAAKSSGVGAGSEEDLLALARIRKEVSKLRGGAVYAKWDRSEEAAGYAGREDVENLATRGPLTPDHIIRTKHAPVVVGEDVKEALADYAKDYEAYFSNNASEGLQMLDASPRFAVWKDRGTISFGRSMKEAGVLEDIVRNTVETVQLGEACGGWNPLSADTLFEIEYWELEQAKLRKAGTPGALQGKVALVTGAAAGIGFACADCLREQGVAVVALDLNPEVEEIFSGDNALGLVCDLTNDDAVKEAIHAAVRKFGGLDIIVSNAGIFTAGANIEDLEQNNWDKSMAVNLTSHQKLLKWCIPFLKEGIEASAIFLGSRNVHAPGAGASSYSVAKAGLTQMVRVAAMELAPEGVRVNIIHPDAVFDTKLWTPEVLQRSADRYGMTVEEYKTRNLLKTEITSRDVGLMTCAVAGPAFAKTTGAQIPVDGGNDRVI